MADRGMMHGVEGFFLRSIEAAPVVFKEGETMIL